MIELTSQGHEVKVIQAHAAVGIHWLSKPDSTPHRSRYSSQSTQHFYFSSPR